MAEERSIRSVFVGNIPYEATEEQLKEIFLQAGPVISFRLVYDRETGKPKGYGFCEYQDQETAQSAMRNLNNHDFNGRSLRVGVAAGDQAKDETRTMQQMFGGTNAESPFGEPVEPEKAPEAISRAVASLPPEQMYELMKQMKLCIQNNPNEARNMLLQNPQLAYALLQAQIVMKIVDPQVALAMLHRPIELIPPIMPQVSVPSSSVSNSTPVDVQGPSSNPPIKQETAQQPSVNVQSSLQQPPRMIQPISEQPRMIQPMIEQPRMIQPMIDQPRMIQPMIEQPRMMIQPMIEQPTMHRMLQPDQQNRMIPPEADFGPRIPGPLPPRGRGGLLGDMPKDMRSPFYEEGGPPGSSNNPNQQRFPPPFRPDQRGNSTGLEPPPFSNTRMDQDLCSGNDNKNQNHPADIPPPHGPSVGSSSFYSNDNRPPLGGRPMGGRPMMIGGESTGLDFSRQPPPSKRGNYENNEYGSMGENLGGRGGGNNNNVGGILPPPSIIQQQQPIFNSRGGGPLPREMGVGRASLTFDSGNNNNRMEVSVGSTARESAGVGGLGLDAGTHRPIAGRGVPEFSSDPALSNSSSNRHLATSGRGDRLEDNSLGGGSSLLRDPNRTSMPLDPGISNRGARPLDQQQQQQERSRDREYGSRRSPPSQPLLSSRECSPRDADLTTNNYPPPGNNNNINRVGVAGPGMGYIPRDEFGYPSSSGRGGRQGDSATRGSMASNFRGDNRGPVMSGEFSRGGSESSRVRGSEGGNFPGGNNRGGDYLGDNFSGGGGVGRNESLGGGRNERMGGRPPFIGTTGGGGRNEGLGGSGGVGMGPSGQTEAGRRGDVDGRVNNLSRQQGSSGNSSSVGTDSGGPSSRVAASIYNDNLDPQAEVSSENEISAQDQEKAALIMQVLQLSEEQIATLPADQRQSILILKEQIAKSASNLN